MSASLYEPINVYKPLAPDIGIVDGPLEYLTVSGIRLPFPFTTRMTVVRLSNGDLFLHSPIKFDESVAKELQELGRVRHLVSPNQFHYAHIGEWVRAFPETISWASPGVRRRARARHVDIDLTKDLDAGAPEEWRRDMDQLLFPGAWGRFAPATGTARRDPSRFGVANAGANGEFFVTPERTLANACERFVVFIANAHANACERSGDFGVRTNAPFP
jgi:hypothetical protein